MWSSQREYEANTTKSKCNVYDSFRSVGEKRRVLGSAGVAIMRYCPKKRPDSFLSTINLSVAEMQEKMGCNILVFVEESGSNCLGSGIFIGLRNSKT